MELREQIAQPIDLLFRKYHCGYSQKDMDICADQILSLIREAGYKSPKEFASFLASIAEETLKKAREGYVKLANDQSLPVNPYVVLNFSGEGLAEFAGNCGYTEGQEDMLKANFRKVELEG